MSFVKNTLDFFKRNVLGIRPAVRSIEDLPAQRRSMPTFRTYTLGGDPFNDRIEFHLTDAGTSGFGDPVPEGEVLKRTKGKR